HLEVTDTAGLSAVVATANGPD